MVRALLASCRFFFASTKASTFTSAASDSRLRWRALAIVAALALGFCAWIPQSASATNCPSYVPEGYGGCTGVSHTPWKYLAFGQAPGCFYPETTALSELQDFMVPCLHSLLPSCGLLSFGGTTGISDPWYFGGTMIRYTTSHIFQWSKTLETGPACSEVGQGGFNIIATREPTCPTGYSAWESSDASQAVCSIETTVPDVSKNLGPCASSDGGGGGCTNFAGNPINIGTQNKYQREVDYVGTGAFPLTVARHYNSRASTPVSTDPGVRGFTYFGLGWSADYFQTLRITSFSEATYVHAYRPDGRVIAFGSQGGAFAADSDVVEKLAAVTGGYTLTTADDTQERYNSAGQLLWVRNRAGQQHTLSYNSHDQLTSVTDSFGHTLSFSYKSTDINAAITSITDPAGQQYVYDTTANLKQVTHPDSTVKKYLYRTGDAYPHLLVGIIDENNIQYATYTYEAGDEGIATSTTHAGGALAFTIAGNGDGTVSVTDPLGDSRILSFTTINSVAKTTSSGYFCNWCGHSTMDASYDANGNVFSSTDYNNITTNFVYNLSRNLETSRTEAAGTPRARTTTKQWHATFRLPTLITQPRHKTAFTHDANGNILSTTHTDTTVSPNVARTWTYAYDSYGRKLTEDGPRTDVSDVTTYTYNTCTTGYGCGQLATVADAVGNVTTYSAYNAHGQSTTIVDPNGVVTSITYNLRQRVSSITVASETTTYEYWPTGLLKKVTQPDLSYLLYRYDDAHRLYRIEDGQGSYVEYTLDAMGNHTAESVYDPASTLTRTRTQVFNSLNQLWKQVASAGTEAVTTSYEYDNNGNRTTTASPLGRGLIATYDELNRLTQITNAAGGTTKFGFDANDNLTSVRDPRNLLTSYAYNGFGQVITLTSPDTGITTSSYDSAGNLATSTDARNAVTTYTYDALDRVTSASFKVGATTDQTIAFTYDSGAYGKGHLTGASDANHSLAWVYDALGRITGKGQTVGTSTLSVGYGYNAGRLVTITLPSGQPVTYGYDVNGQISSVTVGSTAVLSSVTYEPFGAITGWMWGNGSTTSRTFDTDGKLTAFDSAGLKTYSYDDAARITGITDTMTASNSWAYGYDLLDRITSASKTGTTLGWTYDANGNRKTQTGSGASTYTMASTSNRVNSITGALSRSYTYDAAGHVTGYTAATTTYNYRGRLQTLTKAGITVTYVYNALGQLVKQNGGPSGTVLYLYDEAGHLIGEYTDAGAPIQETVWLGDIPVATLRPGGALFYVHADHLNSPIRVTRPSDNKLMWRWFASPFGTDAANENPAGGGAFKYNVRFAGQLYDAHAGLHQNHFRDFDPATGRYLQSDPIGLHGGINTYAYVAGNPLSLIDLMGLACQKGERALRDEAYKNLGSRKEVGEFIVPFVGQVHADIGVSPEPPQRLPTGGIRGPRAGIGPNLSWDIIYFVWKQYEVKKGHVYTKFFSRRYHCTADDPCQQPREWDEIRNDGVEQEAFLDVYREWQYDGTRPSGYTTSMP